MPNNELQEILGARFREHTHPTDEAVWSAIEAQLDSEKSNRKGIWFWIFNGIAATVLFGCMFRTSGSGEGLNIRQTMTSMKSKLGDETQQQVQSASDETKAPAKTEPTKEEEVDNSTLIESKARTESRREISQESDLTKSAVGKSNGVEPIAIIQDSDRNPLLSIANEPNKRENPRVIDKSQKVNKKAELDNDNVDVSELKYLPLNSASNKPNIHTFDYQGVLNLQKNTRVIPIHIGAEFSYLKKHRTFEGTSWNAQDSAYSITNSYLANNRQFEGSVFAQFDFTHRFSASFGLGYSRSSANFSAATADASSQLGTVSQESQLHIFTVPIQTKFNFFSKKRIALNGGLTIQGEFGRITHSEEFTPDTNSSIFTSVPESTGGSIVEATNFQQLALEPYLQLSFQLTPRISAFSNFGYRMYVIQNMTPTHSMGRLNYFNADIGLLLRLR